MRPLPLPSVPLLGLALATLSSGACVRPGPTAGPPAEAEPATASPNRFARRLGGAVGVAYAAEVEPGVYRGGTPDEAGVAWLKKIGVRTVINLRHYHGDTEGERVTAAGLRYERIPLESSDAPEPAEVERFLTLAGDPSLRPLYVHCLHGVDRTGAMMAVYRMEMSGWSKEAAIAEMDHFGPHAIWKDLKRFVREYQPRRLRAGTPAP